MPKEQKYPWQQWWSAPTTHVACQEQYDISPRHFQIQALTRARQDGVAISTRLCRRHKGCVILHLKKAKKVNWDVMLNGTRWPVMHTSLGITKPESFIRNARLQASKRGLRLEIDRWEDGMFVQAMGPRR